MATALTEKVQNALDEVRMLMLGTQVLIGFSFHSILEPGFERLSVAQQELTLVSLTLLLTTLGLLLWPGAFHQQVERGEDTARMHRFASRVMTLALLPFAIGVGLDLAMAFDKVLGGLASVVGGLAGAVLALVCWYGLEGLSRHPTHLKESPQMSEAYARTPLDTRIKQVLTEARVVLPGAQALLGFQLIAVLTDAFDKLPDTSKQVHLVSLGLLALSTILLMTPAAYHRTVEKGENSEHFHRFASRVVLTAMVPLGLAIAGDFYIVFAKVTKSEPLAIAATALLIVLYFGCWFGYSMYARRAREQRQDDLRSTASATGIPRML